MDPCILCSQPVGNELKRGTVKTGRLESSLPIDFKETFQAGTRGTVITFRNRYADVFSHTVEFCHNCWGLNLRFKKILKALLIVQGLATVTAIAPFLIKGGHGTPSWLFGFMLIPFLFIIFAHIFMVNSSPTKRAIATIIKKRRSEEPGKNWVAIEARWPGKPYRQQNVAVGGDETWPQ